MAHTISQMSSRFLKTITTGYLFFADIHYFYIMKWRHMHQFFQFSCFYLSICLAPIIQIIIDIFSCFLWLFCITIWQCRYIKVFVKRWRHSVVFARLKFPDVLYEYTRAEYLQSSWFSSSLYVSYRKHKHNSLVKHKLIQCCF